MPGPGRVGSPHPRGRCAMTSTPRVTQFLAGSLATALLVIVPTASRAAPAAAPNFTKTNLISDLPGMARMTDPNLVNPWGMALGLNSGLWISENGSGHAESVDANGQPL